MPPDGNIHTLRPPLRVVEQAPAGRYGFEEPTRERFDLRGWADGYAIYDGGDLIVTIHGPQYALASRIFHALRDDAATPGDAA